jgi:hypothetical protein
MALTPTAFGQPAPLTTGADVGTISLPDGSIVTAFVTTGNNLYIQKVNPDGTKYGNAVSVASGITFADGITRPPEITALANGNFAVSGIDLLKIYDSNLNLLGNGFVNTAAFPIAVAQGANDTLLAVFADPNRTGGISGRILNLSGQLIRSLPNFDTRLVGSRPAALGLGNGNFLVVSYTSDSTVVADVISPTGEILKSTTLPKGVELSATKLPDGRSIVAWASEGTAGIFYQLFDATGTAVGSPAAVSTAGGRWPISVVLDSGQVLFAWQTGNVLYRILNTDGTWAGPAQTLVTGTGTAGLKFDIARIANGLLAVTYSGGLNSSLLNQVFAPKNETDYVQFAASPGQTLNGTSSTANYLGALAGGTLNAGPGKSYLIGSSSNDALNGGVGNDTFYGGTGSNTLNGSGGLNTALYIGSASSYSVTRDGAVTKVTGANINDSLTHIQRLQFADKTVQIELVAPKDVNGDATSDILFKAISNGQVASWTVSNGTFSGYNNVGNAGGYAIVGSGDVNGDGTADILFQDASGNVADWIIQNGTFSAYNNVGDAGAFKVVGTGDFNGDGTSDAVFQDGSGNVALWTLQDGKFQSYANLGNAGGYKVVATGDLNGDGTTDLVFQDAAGNVADWMIKDGKFSSYNALGNAGGFKVVGTGDVNADGTMDIVFQNASGQVADWIMNNGKFQAYNNVGNASGFSVVGTGDYNGDGTSDILFQNAGGQVVNWTLKNGQFNSYNNVGTAAGYKAS